MRRYEAQFFLLRIETIMHMHYTMNTEGLSFYSILAKLEPTSLSFKNRTSNSNYICMIYGFRSSHVREDSKISSQLITKTKRMNLLAGQQVSLPSFSQLLLLSLLQSFLCTLQFHQLLRVALVHPFS